MRRLVTVFFAAFALALMACSPASAPAAASQSTTTSVDIGASAGSTGAGHAETTVFTLQPAALGGQWSFDRTCGLYDLVFTKDDVTYYDYADQANVVSYAGTWAAGANNRVVLTLRRLDAHGAPSGGALTYNLDVTEPPTTDLIGSFGLARGEMHNITAKQCANEDRE